MKKALALLLSLLLCAMPPAVGAAPDANAPLMDGATLVTFGDSITALSTWPQSVAKNLNMKLVNSGIGGNTTAHAMVRYDRDVAAHNPDFVIMCFGTNDFYCINGSPKVDLATYKTNLQNFIDKTIAIGAQPIFMTPPFVASWYSAGTSLPVNQALDVYVNAMRDVANANGIGLIDMHAVCDNGGYNTGTFLVGDGVHLATQGNTVFTDTICEFMKATYRQDSSAPRVEYPTAPAAEPGVWTKDIVSMDVNDWLNPYPDEMSASNNTDGALVFANKTGLWPEMHYSPTIDKAVTVPVEGSYLTVDVDLTAGTNFMVFFNGPNATLTYANTYVSLTDALKAAVPSLQISGSDILGNQSIHTTLPLSDFVPTSYIAADGTVVFSGMKVFAVGAAGAPVVIHEMSVTTTDSSVVPEYKDAVSLLPTETSIISQNQGVVTYQINQDGSLSLARAAESDISWPSVKVAINKTIDLKATPYLHLKTTTGGGWANGYLYYTTSTGVTGHVQLSQLNDGSEYDFASTDVYVDLTKALGTHRTITLNYYTLSVYGEVGDYTIWNTLSTARDTSGDPDYTTGDVNDDGTINTSDAADIFRFIINGVSLNQYAADVDGDGNITTSDARAILVSLIST